MIETWFKQNTWEFRIMFTYIISCYELTGFKFLEPMEVFDHKTKRPFKYST